MVILVGVAVVLDVASGLVIVGFFSALGAADVIGVVIRTGGSL
jgi:hypothetical protein